MNIPKPFNGTVMPIEKIPNAITWKGDHYKDNFSTIGASDLILLPKYDAEILLTPDSSLKWGVEEDNEIRNAKIAYSVVYLGNYELDHKENAGSHLAVDIRIPKGTPIQAIANGIIVQISEKSSGFGHYVVIEHPNVPDYPNAGRKTTLYSSYCHLGAIKVKKGQAVNKGDEIALSGNTGTSTTPHLHFQIDRKDAPWHPYWPFTWSEAQNAGMSFFDAVNSGLNQTKAKENTINPMLWVQSHLNDNLTASAGASDQTEDDTDNNSEEVLPEFSVFEITASKTKVYTGDQIKIKIVALDQNEDVLTDYTPSTQFKISADSGSSRYPRRLIFENGETSINFSEMKEKTVILTVKDNDIQESIELKFSNPPIIEPDDFEIMVSKLNVEQGEKVGIVIEALKDKEKILTYTPSNDFLFTINSESIPIQFSQGVADLVYIADKLGEIIIEVSDYQTSKSIILNVGEFNSEDTNTGSTSVDNDINDTTIVSETKPEELDYLLEISGESVSLAGSPLILIVKVYDDEKNIIKDFNLQNTIPVTTSGSGVLYPKILDKDDFVNGIATVNYLASIEENTEIFVGDASYEVSFIEQINEVSAFEIEHDGKFIPNTPELITIKSVDKNGKYAPNYNSLGKVKFTLIDGAGIFSPKELSINDFENGIAEVVFIASSDGDVKIKAQNGAIVGISRYIRADRDGVFQDVDADHEFAEAITYLKENDIISGYDDGTFKPDQTVSRVEALKMILRGLDIEIDESVDLSFPDTENGAWYVPYISTGLREEIVGGYPDGTFKPANSVIRAEYLKILLETSQVEINDNVENKPYYDVDKTEWYAKYAMFSKKNHLFVVKNNQLKPTESVTRGEVADTIYKMILLTE